MWGIFVEGGEGVQFGVIVKCWTEAGLPRRHPKQVRVQLDVLMPAV